MALRLNKQPIGLYLFPIFNYIILYYNLFVNTFFKIFKNLRRSIIRTTRRYCCPIFP
nr:MAG TPA: hypothetical protein [Caudoviricetes sp.]